MFTWTDRLVAAPAWFAHSVLRILGGSRRGVWLVVTLLVLASAIPTSAIGISQRPTDLTFEDVRLQRIPANTTWVRLEGDLRASETTNGVVYHLYADGDDQHSIVVTALEPLEVGQQVMTGHLSLGAQGGDTIGFLDADVPPVPRRDEPFQLILLPAAIAIVIVIGLRLGYPVIRRDRRTIAAQERPVDRDAVPAMWSGRIGRDLVADDAPVPCDVRTEPVADLPDLADLRVRTPSQEWSVRIRRGAPVRPVRLCRIGGSNPGLEVHASSADLVFTLADRAQRDRLIGLLG